jgi:hypothetical protein
VESFTYLGSIVDKQGETDDNVKIKIGKVDRFPEAKRGMNIRIPTSQHQCKVNTRGSKLLYGAETWRTTVNTIKKIQIFINNCLRKVLRITLA